MTFRYVSSKFAHFSPDYRGQMKGSVKLALVALAVGTAALVLVLIRPGGEDAGAGEAAPAAFDLEFGAEPPETVERLEVEQGQRVTITVTLGFPSLVHLHGYDLMDETGPGQPPAELEFVADVPGRFDLEAHGEWETLAQLVVAP
jgi:hypothetical protein